MAKRDYICCAGCDTKMIPDGYDNGREHLEMRWGDPEADDWTVDIYCPDCQISVSKLIEWREVMASFGLEHRAKEIQECINLYKSHS